MTATDRATSSNHRPSPTSTAPCRRKALGLAAGSLLVAQLAHFFTAVLGNTPQAHHAGPGRILHMIGLVGTTVLIAAILRRSPRAAHYTLGTGTAVALSVFVFHAMPLETDYTNYYGADVSFLQWLAVAVVIVSGSYAAATGWRHRPNSPA